MTKSLRPNDESMPKLEWISRATARERSTRPRPQIESANRFNGAHFIAPHFATRANLIADLARPCKTFFVRANQRSRIGKTPVQSLRHTRKNRAALGAGFITNGDHVGE